MVFVPIGDHRIGSIRYNLESPKRIALVAGYPQGRQGSGRALAALATRHGTWHKPMVAITDPVSYATYKPMG
jgi:hypothetical protein